MRTAKSEITKADGLHVTARRRTAVHKSNYKRRYPIGAELISEKETHFRIWAPKAQQLDVVLDETSHPLEKETGGYFSGTAPAGAGSLYRFRVDGNENSYPDPASRFQPSGPHGPSCVVDPFQFKWTDSSWRGLKLPGQIIYELHIGTFTNEGTWREAAKQLRELVKIGITAIEMMPVADFPGPFGWGYDGVDLFAPTHLYGKPDDLRAFVNEAHSLGLAVILDVVYNHFGPEGNYLSVYSDHYLTKRHDKNDWGDSINFDGPNSGPVREFFVTNGRYWIDEYHFDGFRFDATQSVIDHSEEYIIGAIGRAARGAAGKRSLILIAENEEQEAKLARPRKEGGDDLDGVWNDDWHHSAIVALTGRNEAYYTDYKGTPQEFVSAAKYGYLFQGQPYYWQEALRGMPTFGIPPAAFVSFLENHDQVSNAIAGERIRFSTSSGKYRAMTALLLLGPWTPLLFQGQEFGASSPFVYFADLSKELNTAIRKGRFDFLRQFPSMRSDEVQANLPDPADSRVFQMCKLDFSEREKNRHLYDLHQDLIRLRREDARFKEQKPRAVDGAVLTANSFVLRFFGNDHDDRLLIVNYGPRVRLEPIPEPLLAPPLGFQWEMLWTSDSPRYGGPGPIAIATDERWLLPAEATTVLRPTPRTSPRQIPSKRRQSTE
jgi:maltooligosyltrehalose trehalohydrolase